MPPCPFCSRMEGFHVWGYVQKSPWNVQYILFLPASALDEAILKCLLHSGTQWKPYEPPDSPRSSNEVIFLHVPPPVLISTFHGASWLSLWPLWMTNRVLLKQRLTFKWFQCTRHCAAHSPMLSSYLPHETRAVTIPTLGIRKQMCRKAKTLPQSCPVSKWHSWVSNPWPGWHQHPHQDHHAAPG